MILPERHLHQYTGVIHHLKYNSGYDAGAVERLEDIFRRLIYEEFESKAAFNKVVENFAPNRHWSETVIGGKQRLRTPCKFASLLLLLPSRLAWFKVPGGVH